MSDHAKASAEPDRRYKTTSIKIIAETPTQQKRHGTLKQKRHGTLNPYDPQPTPFTRTNEKPENRYKRPRL
jgi:hypothetical protein